MSSVREAGLINDWSSEREECDVSESLNSVGAITLFVGDPKRSKAFYEQVFELPVLFEDENSVAFRFENTIVNLLEEPAAHELIEPATVGGNEAGSRLQLTIFVEDANAVVEQLREERGVELLNGPIDRPWGMRTAAFADPDGHVWEVAQQIGEG
jgi:catechol 2,3-dioxygenase-like lactoylglutathione lyase family enzyme